MLSLIRRLKRKLRGEFHLEDLKKMGLQIGKSPKIQGGVIIDSSHCWHISIGDFVTLAPRVHILAHDASTKAHLGYTRIGNVRIGDNVFIGAGSIILPGVEIGDNVIVGAGSVVTKDIPSSTVACGNPARVVSSLEEFLDRSRKYMESCACFGEEYTMACGVTDTMREEMVRKTGRRGYLV